MDVIIVCHTEFGFVSNGEVIYDKAVKSGVEEGVKNLISLADKYNAKITFAVCPEVVDYFPKNIKHEIGLHIHPGYARYNYKNFSWIAGDLYLKENCKQSINSSVLKDFSYEEQLDMVTKGRNYIIQKLGMDPKVFVAGRWSLNNNTIKVLIENKIAYDCSAVAHVRSDHYDWSKLPRISMPYHPDASDYQEKGNLGMLIVPVSQALLNGIVSPESTIKYGLSWIKACFLEYYKQKSPLFHICLHSPSMTDAHLLSAMEKFLSFISKKENINFKFVSEIKEYPEKTIRGNILPYFFAGNYNILKSGIKKVFKIRNEQYHRQNNI